MNHARLARQLADPDPSALRRLASAAERYAAELDPLEIVTGDLDDERHPIDHRSPLYCEMRRALDEQDSWSAREHAAYWTERRILEHRRPPGGSGRTNIGALAFGYVEALSAGVPESAMADVLGCKPKKLRYRVRPIASRMLQELGAPPLPGCEAVDVSSLPCRYPRVMRLGDRRRRYLPLLTTSPWSSRQPPTSSNTLIADVLPRVNAWVLEHPRPTRSFVEEFVAAGGGARQ